MSKADNGLKVLKASIENFKNISYKEIEFDGRSVIIAGKNQMGKSSLIQAILSPVNSQYIPIEPIKEGEEKGKAEIVIGGKHNGQDVRYTVSLYFSEANKRGRLVLHDKDGTQIKGGERNFLDGLIGDISFNIMEFIRLGVTDTGKVSKEGVKKQIEILKELMPREVLESLYALEHEKTDKYEARTEINREVKFLKEQIDKSPFTQEEIDKYSEALDSRELSAKLKDARELNDKIDKSIAYISETEKRNKEIDDEIILLETKIKNLKSLKESHVSGLESCQKFLEKNSKVDLTELESQFDNIAEHNTNVARIKELDNAKQSLMAKEKESNDLTERLKNIEQEKKDLFANAKMPVKGLAFDDEVVTFRGLPLSDGNIPTSQLIGVGLKIGMALNPNLRLLVIKDGSLLDQETMDFVLSTCEKKGYQVLIEVVNNDKSGEVSLEFIEN